MLKNGSQITNNYYFTNDVDKAIDEYNSSGISKEQQDKIYVEQIHPALSRLVECVINTMKFYLMKNMDITDLQSETLDHLYSIIPKCKPIIDGTRGKAFSWFSVCAKWFLISKSRQQYKTGQIYVFVPNIFAIEDTKMRDEIDYDSSPPDEIDNTLFNSERIQEIVSEFESFCMQNYTDVDKIAVAFSLVKLIEEADLVGTPNKHMVYSLIRDTSGVKNPVKITGVIKDLEVIYRKHTE